MGCGASTSELNNISQAESWGLRQFYIGDPNESESFRIELEFINIQNKLYEIGDNFTVIVRKN